MALISLRQLLDHAAEHSYGVPSFNVNNLEQIQAILEAASETDSPVIVQISAGARKYAGEPAYSNLCSPGPWCISCSLFPFNTERFQFGHDGWFFEGRCEDTFNV